MRDRASHGGFEVMEHREPPRSAAEDHSHPAVAPAVAVRLNRLDGPRVPDRPPGVRSAPRHAAVLPSLSVLVAAIPGYRAGVGRCVAWLGDQPAYQLPFRSIVLDPPPPAGIGAGVPRSWRTCVVEPGCPRRSPLLKLEPDELEHVFKLSPWTEEVLKITYPPARRDHPAELSTARWRSW